MSQSSTIEWTDTTWISVVGCDEVSPGCDNCYARVLSFRLARMALALIAQGKEPGRKRYYIDVVDDEGNWTGKINTIPEAVTDPFRWKKPRMIFVNSMSDTFHKSVPDEFIERLCRVMERADWHTYQVLTKRSSRLRNLLQGRLRWAAELPHVWWGVSAENRRHGLLRIEHLRQTPAAVRFLSVEPLLEGLGDFNLDGIHWAITGGESGHGCRPLREEWVTSVRDQCERAGVKFFFKQWGGVNKKQTGRLLQGRTYDEFPVRVQNPVADRQQRQAWIAEFSQS